MTLRDVGAWIAGIWERVVYDIGVVFSSSPLEGGVSCCWHPSEWIMCSFSSGGVGRRRHCEHNGHFCENNRSLMCGGAYCR